MEQQELTLQAVVDAYLNPTAPSEPTKWEHSVGATFRDCKELRTFDQAIRDAKKRNVSWQMSYIEWLYTWLTSGKWPERGQGKGKYVMARRGPDIGPYAVGNVDIKTHEENSSERVRVVKVKPEPSHRKSASHKANMALAAQARYANGIAPPPSRAKPVYAAGQLYPSMADAAKALGTTRVTVQKRIKAGREGYSYVD